MTIKTWKLGSAMISENRLCKPPVFHVSGQNGESRVYIMKTFGTAVRLAATVDHWNRTGERRKFSAKEAKSLLESAQ